MLHCMAKGTLQVSLRLRALNQGDYPPSLQWTETNPTIPKKQRLSWAGAQKRFSERSEAQEMFNVLKDKGGPRVSPTKARN